MKLRKHPLEPFDLFLINLAAQLDTSTVPQWLIWSDILACKMVPHCLPRSKRFAAFRTRQIQLIVLCNTLGESIIAHLCQKMRSVKNHLAKLPSHQVAMSRRTPLYLGEYLLHFFRPLALFSGHKIGRGILPRTLQRRQR